jgi:hypothetical protein
MGEVFDYTRGCFPEKVHAYAEKQGIDDARNNDPPPQVVLPDELMGLPIRLDGYDDLFKQAMLYFTSVSNITNLPLNYSILAPVQIILRLENSNCAKKRTCHFDVPRHYPVLLPVAGESIPF